MGPTLLDTQFRPTASTRSTSFSASRIPADRCGPAGLHGRVLQRQGGCTLLIAIAGYQPFGGGASDGDTATHIQGQSTMSSVKRPHTLQGGIDVRRAQRDRTGGGNRSGQITFDRTYTRQFSDERR